MQTPPQPIDPQLSGYVSIRPDVGPLVEATSHHHRPPTGVLSVIRSTAGLDPWPVISGPDATDNDEAQGNPPQSFGLRLFES